MDEVSSSVEGRWHNNIANTGYVWMCFVLSCTSICRQSSAKVAILLLLCYKVIPTLLMKIVNCWVHLPPTMTLTPNFLVSCFYHISNAETRQTAWSRVANLNELHRAARNKIASCLRRNVGFVCKLLSDCPCCWVIVSLCWSRFALRQIRINRLLFSTLSIAAKVKRN